MNAKFSNLMKILSEKQEATVLFIEVEKQAALAEAEARLTELSEQSRLLRERQDQIAALHDLPDTDLIRVCIPCLYTFGKGRIWFFILVHFIVPVVYKGKYVQVAVSCNMHKWMRRAFSKLPTAGWLHKHFFLNTKCGLN